MKGSAICYLDEVVEARKGTIVVIHSLINDRRIIPIDKVDGQTTGRFVKIGQSIRNFKHH